MRIALFGGSFDPPHRGHLAIARAAAQRLALDQVWMAPAGIQPLKLDSAATSYADRLAMVELAVAREDRILVSAVDAPREDGQPNYTVDVLANIHKGLSAGDKLFFLLGADALLTLKQWHRAAELPFLCDFIVAGRPGFSMDDIAGVFPDGITAKREETAKRPGVMVWKLENEPGRQSHLYLMPDLHEDVSATAIRAAIAGEELAEKVIDAKVLAYIEEKGLYRSTLSIGAPRVCKLR